MVFAAGLELRYVVYCVLAIGRSPVRLLIVIAPYRLKRILSFLCPEGDPHRRGIPAAAVADRRRHAAASAARG